MEKQRIPLVALAVALAIFRPIPACAMEAPGDGGPGWRYEQKTHHWYYYGDGQGRQSGWLNYHGEWYWFDGEGRMADGGNTVIDGVPYYFFINGHMAWNQYVGMKYYNAEGRHQEEHDVRVIGRTSPENADRDLFSDYLYQVPRSWIAHFIQDGWQFMFYKQKKYFAAPSTGQGVYYVYHSVDTHYKKVKFTDVDNVLQAFGEYVGSAAGCYREGDPWMDVLWEEQPAMENVLELPDYYEDDAKFYFGKVFATYLDYQGRKEMLRCSPKSCQVMEEILHSKDSREDRERFLEKARAEREAAARKEERMAQEEGFGPGRKPTGTQAAP